MFNLKKFNKIFAHFWNSFLQILIHLLFEILSLTHNFNKFIFNEILSMKVA